MKNNLPIVAIVGRMNVGKSTLFNRLSETSKSIALDYEGVTRDVIKDVVRWKEHTFELVDTGGISLKKMQHDAIAEQSRQRALQAIKEAAVVLFMCDGAVGLLPEDRGLADMLLKEGKKTILVINKSDTSLAKEHRYEFERLGFKSIIAISAQHGAGIADLLDALLAELPAPVEYTEQEDPLCNVAIVGKPNVGKSSIMNLLLKKERSIVSPIAGTTREPVKETIMFHRDSIQLIDTPGIRRKRGVNETLEQMMVKTAFKAVGQADIVLLVVDASEARLVDQELKLAFYVFEQEQKGLIIIFNKDDLMDEQKRADLDFQLEPYAHLLDKVMQIRTSCITNKNIGKLINTVNDVSERYKMRFSDDDLTFLFKDALVKRPLYRSQRPLIVHKAKQIRTGPIVIELVVNESAWFGPSQLAFFEGVLRKEVDLRGVPIKLVTRKRG